jgi:hypothetical protein
MITIERTPISSAKVISQIAIDSFLDGVASYYRPQGIKAFIQHACPENIEQRMAMGNVFYSALDGADIIGMAELISALNHLSMLFVAVGRQRQGVGRLLLGRLKEDMVNGYCTPLEITVDAAPNAVGAYENFKFVYQGSPRELGGIKFIPMTLPLNVSLYT